MTLGRFAILFALLSAAIAVVGCSSDEDRLIDTIQADELATIFEPDPDNGYHWDGVQDPFFEGWYFNIKDPEQAIAFLFIYGIINPADHNRDTSQAFVYVVNAVSGEQLFKSYPVSDFSASREYCDVVIAGNRATEVKIAGSIEEGGISARWSIDFDIEIEFPQIMGWLRHAVNLPIYWFVNAIKSWASGFIWESLQGTVHLSLYEKSTRFPWSWEALTEATAEWAGLGYGDLRELPVTPRE